MQCRLVHWRDRAADNFSLVIEATFRIDMLGFVDRGRKETHAGDSKAQQCQSETLTLDVRVWERR